VTKGGTRLIAALAATALVALLLVACGNSDSGSSDSGSTPGTNANETSAQDNGSGGGTEGENDAGGGEQEQSGSPDASGKSSSGFSAAEVETPLKVSGGGSAQFRTKGGDNSIQEYGEEKDESELQEAAEAVHGFFVARATSDWAKACGYLSKAMSEQLEQLAASSTELEDKGCAPFLEAFTSKLSASAWRETTAVDARSLRQEGEQAFLIYYGEPHKTAYAMPLKVEDGQFKVGALSAAALG